MTLTNSYSAEIFGLILCSFLFLLFSNFRKLFFFPKFETTPQAIEKRSSIIDFIRGISIIGIVIIHLDSYFRYYHPNDSFSNITFFLSNASRFSVPAFIISSAFFLNYKSPKEYWLSKWNNLIMPYLIIGTIAYILKYPLESIYTIFDYIYKIFSGTIMAPFYFVPLMVQCYLIYALFVRRFEKTKSIYIVLWISFVLNIFSNLDWFQSTNLYINGLIPAFFGNFVFFFLVGFSAKNIFKDSGNFKNTILTGKIFLFSLVISLLFYLIFVGYLSMKKLPELSNHFIFYPLAMFILLFSIGIKLEESVSNILQKIYSIFSFIGKMSLSIFLIHPILIHLSFGRDPYSFGGKVSGFFFFLLLNIIIPIFLWISFQKLRKIFFN